MRGFRSVWKSIKYIRLNDFTLDFSGVIFSINQNKKKGQIVDRLNVTLLWIRLVGKIWLSSLVKYLMLINDQYLNIHKLYIKGSSSCQNGTFLGHCYRNEVRICFNGNLYQTTMDEIQKVDNSLSNFSLICNCTSKPRHI